MRSHVLLTVIVALIAGMAGTAAAGERGGHHRHVAPHPGIQVHAGHHRRVIAPSFRHHHAKRLHSIRPGWAKSAHDRSWRGDVQHRFWQKKRWHPHAGFEHRGHQAHRPLAIAPLFGGGLKVIIGPHGRDFSKRHHHFSTRRHHFSKHHRRFRD